MGISAPTDLWTEADLERVEHHVRVYKELRPLICEGGWYRLTPDPDRDGRSGWAAMCVVRSGGAEAALFAYRLSEGSPTARFAIPGLETSALYDVTDDDGRVIRREGGDVLGTVGTDCHLNEPFRSVLLRFKVSGEVEDKATPLASSPGGSVSP
jgi:hypothetical protein